MNSFATFVTALYEGIFEDAAIRWPTIRDTMEKDLSYLRSALEHRGESFFTITLPDFGKLIDQWVDEGRIFRHYFMGEKETFDSETESGRPALSLVDDPRWALPRGITSKEGFPILFGGLLRMVFEVDGKLRADVEPDVILFLRALTRVCEKLEAPVSFTALRKSVKEFLRCGTSSSGELPQYLG
jgi:hypothetical protein